MEAGLSAKTFITSSGSVLYLHVTETHFHINGRALKKAKSIRKWSSSYTHPCLQLIDFLF